MNCINLTSKWSKILLRRKTFETTQNYKSDQIGRQNEQKLWVTSQNIQNYAKLQNWSNYMNCIDSVSKRSKERKTTKVIKLHELHRFRVQTIKTTQNYKSDQIIMNCIDLTSKLSKMWSYVAKHSKPLNYKSDQIGRQNDLKCWVTSQTIQNNAKLQKWSKYNDLHRYDVKSDQITMNLHRFDVKTI